MGMLAAVGTSSDLDPTLRVVRPDSSPGDDDANRGTRLSDRPRSSSEDGGRTGARVGRDRGLIILLAT